MPHCIKQAKLHVSPDSEWKEWRPGPLVMWAQIRRRGIYFFNVFIY